MPRPPRPCCSPDYGPCPLHEGLIIAREMDRDCPEDLGPDVAGERQYEAWLDRMGAA